MSTQQELGEEQGSLYDSGLLTEVQKKEVDTKRAKPLKRNTTRQAEAIVVNSQAEGYNVNEVPRIIAEKGVDPEQFAIDKVTEGVRIVAIDENVADQSITIGKPLVKAINERSGIRVGTIAVLINSSHQKDFDAYMVGMQPTPPAVTAGHNSDFRDLIT